MTKKYLWKTNTWQCCGWKHSHDQRGFKRKKLATDVKGFLNKSGKKGGRLTEIKDVMYVGWNSNVMEGSLSSFLKQNFPSVSSFANN